jgi:hypothetical protein
LLPAQAASSATENDIATMRIMMELSIDARPMRANWDGIGAMLVPNFEKAAASRQLFAIAQNSRVNFNLRWFYGN